MRISEDERANKLVRFQGIPQKGKIDDILVYYVAEEDLEERLKDIELKKMTKGNLNPNKIQIIQNYADVTKIYPISPDKILLEKLKLKNSKVIGFIGSINKYESIRTLIKSMQYVINDIPNIKILLVGREDPKYIKVLKKFSKELKLSKYILFIGSVPHQEIKKYYSIIDVIVIPHLNLNVCRKVTPLNPMEALAFKKLIIASDLPALRYIVIPNKIGDLFKAEGPKALSPKIIYYLNHPEKRIEIENYARNYIEQNYNWKKGFPKYNRFYQNILNIQSLTFKII